jgi:hypothetical protein
LRLWATTRVRSSDFAAIQISCGPNSCGLRFLGGAPSGIRIASRMAAVAATCDSEQTPCCQPVQARKIIGMSGTVRPSAAATV